MSKIWNDPGRIPKAKFHGDMDLCLPYIKEARRVMMRHMTQMTENKLDIQVGATPQRYQDGTVIVARNRGELLQLDIYSPEEEAGEESQSYFQCDLYEDDPEFPEDLTKQTKRSIWFSVHEVVGYDVIDERHGNYEWIGEYGLITWDATQCWARGISNKKAWNDGILGPYGNVGCPYIRPEHAKRSGELTTIFNDYPIACDTLAERGLWNVDALLVFEPDDVQVHKQVLFIKNIKYTIQFPFSEQLIMGACAHTTDEGIPWCVVVTQPFRNTPGTVGLAFTYEEVWSFLLDGNVNPTPIKIHTYYLTLPEQDLYESNKSDITPWQFTSDGKQGCALRSEQYFVSSAFSWGIYSDPRFIYLDFTYTRSEVTCVDREDTSVTDDARTVVNGGAVLPWDSVEWNEWIDTYGEWLDKIRILTHLPTDRNYGPIDIEYKTEESMYAFGGSNKVTVTNVTELPASTTVVTKKEYDIRISNADVIIWQGSYEGKITEIYEKTGPGNDPIDDYTIRSMKSEATNPVGMMYVGGSPYHNIAFFVRIKIIGTQTQYKVYQSGSANTCQDSGYTVNLQLLCIFKGEEVEVGNPIEYKVKSTFDDEPYNSSETDFPLGGVTKEYGYLGLGSHYMVSQLEGSGSYFNFTTSMPSGHTTVGDLGGSIRYAEDGSHCVISCSYMDIAKYIFPWHKYSFDLNITSKLNRIDTMTKLGVSQELQDAWNKYMINYAIIGESEESGFVGSTGEFVGDATALIEAYNSGRVLSAYGIDSGIVEIKQLSNLLFGKVVETEPDKNGDYEFGIKDKDTTAFLPIGRYAGDIEDV